MAKKWLIPAVAVAGAAAGVAAVRRLRAGAGHDDRWHVLTINRPSLRTVPEPLAELGDEIEVRLREAPGGRGTEVAARLTGTGKPDREALRRLRTALREARQLVETGEVLRPDSPPTTHRTLLSRPLELATRHGRGEGLL